MARGAADRIKRGGAYGRRGLASLYSSWTTENTSQNSSMCTRTHTDRQFSCWFSITTVSVVLSRVTRTV